MITGNIMLDVLALLCIGYAGAFLLIPIAQWIDYKRDCKKHGMERRDEDDQRDHADDRILVPDSKKVYSGNGERIKEEP